MLVAWVVAAGASLLAVEGAADTCTSPTCGQVKLPYPTRGVDKNRSGYSPDFAGPFPLASWPSWVAELKGRNRHQTPSIDAHLNVYVGSDMGFISSYDVSGRQRWDVKVGSSAAQNPALLGGVVYTSNSDGFALALDKDTGQEVWRTRICDRLPGDTYSPTAFDDFLIYPAGAIPPFGSPDVVCLNRLDGSIRWKYSVGDKYGGTTGEMASNHIGPKYTTVNLAPCVLGEQVIFNDVSGAVFSLNLTTGQEIWYTAGDDKDTYTLGGSCCGPNNKVYVGFTTSPGQGALQVLDAFTGKKLWRVPYPREVHSAPAVGYINGVLAAVVGVGQPTGVPPVPVHLQGWLHYILALLLEPVANYTGDVYALDASTGTTLWSFTPPPWHKHYCAGSTIWQACLPDLWSGPTIDAAGTVWINWSAGGVLYGLRDANGDGIVSLEDPLETTSFDCGSAATGPPAVADGMVLTVTCRRVVAFLKK